MGRHSVRIGCLLRLDWVPTPFGLGRHSVSGNRLLRFDGLNDSLFVYGLIVFYVLISVTPRAIERKRIFDTV